MSRNAAAPIQRDMQVPFQPMPEGGAGAAGAALQDVGERLSDFAFAKHDFDLAQQRAQDQKDLIQARLSATTQLDSLSDQFRTDTDPDTMAQRYSDAADEIAKTAGGNLKGPVAAQFAEDFGTMAATRLRTIKDIAFGRQTEQAVAGLDDTIETATRAAAFAGNPAERASNLATIQKGIEGLVSAGQLSAAGGQQKMQTAKERLALFDGKRDVFLDPAAALKSLDKPDYLPDLDPLSRVELQNSAEAAVRERQRQAEQAKAQARLDAEQAAGDLHDVIASGLPAAQAVVDRAKQTAIASGDPRAMARLTGLLRAQGFADAMRGAGPREVDEGIAALTAQANAHGADVGIATALSAASAFKGKMNAGLSHDPLLWASQQGVVTVAPLALNGSDPASAFRARIGEAKAVSQHYGVPFQPLTQAEIETVKTRLAGDQDPNSRLAVLQMLVNGFGSDVLPVLGSVGASDPALAKAGALVASGPAHLAAARDVLTGTALLAGKDSGALRPTQSAQAAVNVPNLLGAYALMPEERSRVLDGADAIYAARAARQGKSADLKSGTGQDLYGKAVQEAAGAHFTPDGVQWGGIGTYRGASVLVPPNIPTDTFEDITHGMKGADLAAGSVNGQAPAFGNGNDVWNITRHTYLVSGGNGIYGLSSTDPSKGTITPVKDRSGQPFRFDYARALVAKQARERGGK